MCEEDIVKENYSSEERREYRKKRRLRSQIIAYIVLFLMIALVAVGIVYGVKLFAENRSNNAAAQQELQQTAMDEYFASEESITPPPAPTATPEPTMSPEELFELRIEETIAGMTLTEKVAGLFIVTPEAITGVNAAVQAGDGTKAALEEYAVGGLVYFAKNIESKEQLMEMIAKTKSFSKYPLFIAVDEEGGTVNRVAGAGLAPKQLSAAEIGASGDTNNAYQAGGVIGSYLSEIGFNLNFAPVADLSNVENSVMKSRAYGADAATAAPFLASMVSGLQAQNVTACLKHFPGIGSTTEDTHDGLASTDRTLEEFRSEEFAMFKAGIEAGAGMVMVGHVGAEALSGDLTPASLSEPIVTGYLRNELGFQGVIITDALNMSAISTYYSSEQAAVMALKAGCDMVLMPEDFLQAYAGVLNAVQDGTLSEERINDSLRRIYRIKYAGF